MSREHLVAEVVERADLLLVVLHGHWGILGLGGFVVVLEVAVPQCAHFGPQNFYDPCKEDGGVRAGRRLSWEVRRCLVKDIEFDCEFVVVEFFINGGGRFNILVCQLPFRVEFRCIFILIGETQQVCTVVFQLCSPPLLMTSFEKELSPMDGQKASDHQSPSDFLLGVSEFLGACPVVILLPVISFFLVLFALANPLVQSVEERVSEVPWCVMFVEVFVEGVCDVLVIPLRHRVASASLNVIKCFQFFAMMAFRIDPGLEFRQVVTCWELVMNEFQ